MREQQDISPDGERSISDQGNSAELRRVASEEYNLKDTPTLDGQGPSEAERRSLRKIPDVLPWSGFLVAFIELCERAAFYGLTGPFQNYIQQPYPWDSEHKVRGALGMGQQAAVALTDFFTFWCYVTPILGAIIADQYLGRYKTILYSALIYVVGLLILLVTSFPFSIQLGLAKGGLIMSMIVIGLGSGGIKSNVSPLIAEQVTRTKAVVKTLKNGERVIVDPAATFQRLYMFFYLAINIGALSPIVTTELELNVGFWSAFFLPTFLFVIALMAVVLGRNLYKTRPPQGSIIPKAFKVVWIGIRSRGDLNAAKPSYQHEYGRRYDTPWNDIFVEEVKRGLIACKVFAFFPLYWVVQGQMLNNFVAQAARMELHGMPNDIMGNIDPMTIIVFIPILDYLVYPALRQIGIAFKPITRIFWGFMFASAAMAYAAFVQHLIYAAEPNRIHVALQSPAYWLIGLSEIFASITGLEYAFTKAPSSMKSFIMSLFLFTNAIGSVLGIALTPTAIDPMLVWMYAGLCLTAFAAGITFWSLFSRYNLEEDNMNALESVGVQVERVDDLHTVLRQNELPAEPGVEKEWLLQKHDVGTIEMDELRPSSSKID